MGGITFQKAIYCSFALPNPAPKHTVLFEYKMPLIGSCVWTLGSQMVTMFGEAVETLESGYGYIFFSEHMAGFWKSAWGWI